MHISELLGSFVLQVGFFVCGFCFFFFASVQLTMRKLFTDADD